MEVTQDDLLVAIGELYVQKRVLARQNVAMASELRRLESRVAVLELSEEESADDPTSA